MQTTADRDALERLPTPDEVRQALSRRVREAGVLRRLLRVSEYATSELDQVSEAVIGEMIATGLIMRGDDPRLAERAALRREREVTR